MRLATLVTVLVACKGGGETGDKQPPPAPPPAPPAPARPMYTAAAASDAVVPLDKLPAPRHVVWIDRSGALSYARVAKPWTGALPAQRTPVADLATLATRLQADIADDEANDPTWPRVDYPLDVSESFAPVIAVGRASVIVAERNTGGRAPLVMAPPELPATVLIGLLATIGGRVGVALPGDRFGGLRYVFAPAVATDDTPTFWYEAHVGADRIEMLELIANQRSATTGDSVRVQLAPFVTDKGFDLLFARDVPFERLVEILLAVDALGVTTHLGLGASSGPIEQRKQQALEVRNQGAYRSASAILSLGQLQAIGDLDKAIIRDVVAAKAAELIACYDSARAKNATLRGTVDSQFFITPNGTVASANATGLDRNVAACIEKVIKALAFPRPRGGGGAQVDCPFRFRPIET